MTNEEIIAAYHAELASLEALNANGPATDDDLEYAARASRINTIRLLLSTSIPQTTSRVWVVGFVDLEGHELYLERIEAPTWRDAVVRHTKFPFSEDLAAGASRDELFHNGDNEETQQEHFKVI